MLLLCLSFFYTGINLNLWSAVYGTCIGRDRHWNMADQSSIAGKYKIADNVTLF